MKIVILTTAIFSLLSASALGSYVSSEQWPIVLPPNRQLLLDLKYIETKGCPGKKGRLVLPVVINIHRYLCKTFCPENWEWVASNDGGQCRDIETGFEFRGFDIQYDRGKDGTVVRSYVTAFYGDAEGSLRFTFTTPQGEHWYCFERNAKTPGLICGNDT